MLDIDLKIPLACRVNCLDSKQKMVVLPKVNRTQIPRRKFRTLRRWHSRRKSDIEQDVHLVPKVNKTQICRRKCSVNCVGGMLE